MKLLSPAGNFDSLKTAVYNGADEVYLGINDFNARNNIDGFNINTLKQAVDFAHVFSVKVNLAINILFNDNELQSALDVVVEAYNLGVDAFILQDLGLANLIYRFYPQIELHASTQMGIHNLEGVKFIEQFGFKRVVLARETPLDEVKRIRENSNIEIEYFIQGALCVSFSGNCYLSSKMFNASGNRGKCKQLCRLPYTFEHNGKKLKKGYLLSAKDFNLIVRLDDLVKAGVDVVKIEGRARRPEYVGLVTAEYRKAFDGLKYNQDNLKLAFNRQYVAGYFDGNGDIISDFNNHIGIKIGKVLKVNYGKKFNQVHILSNRKLSPKSSLKFFNGKIENNTVSVYDLNQLSESTYVFTTTQNIAVGDSVHLLTDYDLEKKTMNNICRRSVEIQISAVENAPIKAVYKLNGIERTVFGSICVKAEKQPLSTEQIIKNFNKSEYFDARIDISRLDNVFIPVKELNEFRRQVFQSIYAELTNNKKENLNNIKVVNVDNNLIFNDFQFVFSIYDEFVAKNIVYSPEIYDLTDINKFIDKCNRLNKNPFLDTPNFALKNDIALLGDIIEKTRVPIVVNNYYAFCFETKRVIGAGLNVYNNQTANIHSALYISAENNIENDYQYPYMTLRHCPLKSHANSSCSSCKFDNGFTYVLESGKKFALRRKKLTTCTFYLTDN